MSDTQPQAPAEQDSREKPRGLWLLLSLSADRMIAVLVIIAGILLGVWMFKH